MRISPKTLTTFYLLLLPLIVPALGLGVMVAVLLLLAGLAWRWVLVLRGMQPDPEAPELVLETISASHFVEKVRWALDRLGVDYVEQPTAATLGAFFAGRTVPRLHLRTGIVTSQLGSSSAILRYLWGRYGEQPDGRAEFLRPTTEALALEGEIDRYGVLQQRWIYHHILDDRRLTLHVWGANDASLPRWQRFLLVVLFPLLRALIRRAFGIRPGRHQKTVEKTEAFLQSVEDRLADGRLYLLGGEQPGFVDIAFAAMSGLWVRPELFALEAGDAVRAVDERFSDECRAESERWASRFPLATAHVHGMYRLHRAEAAAVAG